MRFPATDRTAIHEILKPVLTSTIVEELYSRSLTLDGARPCHVLRRFLRAFSRFNVPVQESGDPVSGEKIFKHCSICHKLDAYESRRGPLLEGSGAALRPRPRIIPIPCELPKAEVSYGRKSSLLFF